MNVVVGAVGVMNRDHKVVWPDGWPIPREGDSITIPALDEVTSVRTVVWYPEGDGWKQDPFVYIVVGPSRP